MTACLVGFLLPHFDGHAVDFYVIFYSNHQETASFDDACFDEVKAVRTDFDVYIRCFYGEFAGSGDGRNKDCGMFTGGLFINLVKTLHAFGRSTAFFQEIFDFRLCKAEWNGVFFVFFSHFGEIFMDLAHDLVFTVFSQCLCEDFLEGLFLGLEGDRRRCTEAGIDELVVELLRIFGEVQESVDVGTAVVEGRE